MLDLFDGLMEFVQEHTENDVDYAKALWYIGFTMNEIRDALEEYLPEAEVEDVIEILAEEFGR